MQDEAQVATLNEEQPEAAAETTEPKPAEPEQPAPAQAAGQEDAQAADSDREPAATESLIAELRREAAAYRRRLRETEQLSERMRRELEEKLAEREARLAELEAELLVARREAQERAVRAEVLARAASRGALYPELVWSALDWSRLEFDEQGQPANLDVLLDEIAQRYPVLFSGTPRTSPANVARGQTERTVIRRSDLRDRAFWERHRDEILVALREGRILDE